MIVSIALMGLTSATPSPSDAAAGLESALSKAVGDKKTGMTLTIAIILFV